MRYLSEEEDEAVDTYEIFSKDENKAIDVDMETSDEEWDIGRSRFYEPKKQKVAEVKFFFLTSQLRVLRKIVMILSTDMSMRILII